MLLIGMTGGIGSGKSTVTRFFRELGVPVIDADEVARQIVQPGSDPLNEIIAAFGPDVLDRNGTLDRERMRDIIFSDSQKRHLLEGILHPRIIEEMRRQASQVSAPYCILSIPLLVETGHTGAVDRVLVIDVPEEIQRKRAMQRDNLTARAYRAITLAQASREERLAVADDIIDNGGSLEDLQQQVEAMHRKYRALT